MAQGTVKHRCEVEPESGHFYAYGVQFREPNAILKKFIARASRNQVDEAA